MVMTFTFNYEIIIAWISFLVPNAEDLMPSFMQREKSIQMKSNKQKRKRVGNNKENYEPRIKKIPTSTQGIVFLLIHCSILTSLFVFSFFFFLTVSERPKRKIARVNYTEEEEPSSDRYICKSDGFFFSNLQVDLL